MGRAVSASRCPAPARGWLIVSALVTLAALAARLDATADPPAPTPDLRAITSITSLRQLPEASSHGQSSSYHIRLEGTVLWSSATQDWIVLEDASAAEELELNHHGQPLRPGERVRIEGNGTIERRGAAFKIGVHGPVIDNNGIHAMVEKAGAVYLSAGWHPIRLEWFNGADKYGLELEWEGPNLPRAMIPSSALAPVQAGGRTSGDGPGLAYRCYEGDWKVLPDFARLSAVKSGITTNFDVDVATRRERVGLEFIGQLHAPQDGTYIFHLKSDDGSRLFLEVPPWPAESLGQSALPAPTQLAIGQTLGQEAGGCWAEVEGRLSFVRVAPEGVVAELQGGAGALRLELSDATRLPAASLQNQRVRARGFCRIAMNADGDRIPGLLLVPGPEAIQLLDASSRAEGIRSDAGTESPELATAEAVHQLRREEALRGHTARIRGVVTGVQPEHQAFTVQDATRGLYVVDLSTGRPELPVIGELIEVEGTSDPGLFAPVLNARRVISLGAGQLPEPVHPTWDQLLNGSLDAQYVELQGILAAVHADGTLILLTRSGRIKVELRLREPASRREQAPHEAATREGPELLTRFENALVRIRGCLFADWDYLTHQVKVGEIRIYDADLIVDQPPPADLFSALPRTVAELLLFDPHAGAFQRVKVPGQIVHVRGAEHFLMDGARGLRFVAKEPLGLQDGDLVEVVGFPDLSGLSSPMLREAVARRTGHSPLPVARNVGADELWQLDHDATRVRVEGILKSVRSDRVEQILEMQTGLRTFVARCDASRQSAVTPPIGGRLALTGVYAALESARAGGREVRAFELLLDSTLDIRVLARPPWWTLEKLLFMVGALACVLALSVLWIQQLRRQVAERSSQLEIQIRERQRIEHQSALEQERARIAQDLHDDLGSGITEISMLAARTKSAPALDEKRHAYLDQVVAKARELVTALDEIVWAMNPRHDSLASLVSYFCLYAERFLSLANIAWKLDGPPVPPELAIGSRQRHQLFLVFKEALTNIVRHSGAQEVRLAIELNGPRLRLSIADDGRGLAQGGLTEGMDGVANMRARIEKLGGTFAVTSPDQGGTLVQFTVPTGAGAAKSE
jgi:signal transduction histidine kinase